MDEQRTQAYLNLVNQLLSCNNGDEPRILQENHELLDQNLIEIMVAVAQQYGEAGRENEAQWLMNMAQQLAEALELSENETTETANIPQDSLHFLIEVLRKVNENPNPQLIYPFLAQNLDKLDDNLIKVLDNWANDKLASVDTKEAYSIAGNIWYFSDLVQKFTLGNIAANNEIAITGYEITLKVYTEKAFPQSWALIQYNRLLRT